MNIILYKKKMDLDLKDLEKKEEYTKIQLKEFENNIDKVVEEHRQSQQKYQHELDKYVKKKIR